MRVFNPGKVERYILESIEEKGALLFSVIDPIDHPSIEEAVEMALNADKAGVDVILVGGSTGVQGEILDEVVKRIKEQSSLPVVLFPGDIGTITKYADAIYFMSMLNSSNPYWISKAQMLSAFVIKRAGLEPLPTAYVVVSPGGTVGYVGEAHLIPRDKPKLAQAYALAAQYMGFRFFITDVGSNSKLGHVPLEMVKAVREVIEIPYIVAGGIKTPSQAYEVVKAGADAIQVGTAFERDKAVSSIASFVKSVREGAKARK